MSLGSGRPRLADHTFLIFGRALHPEWFRTRVFRRLVQTGWEADLRVIDGGHAILWRSGRVRIAELLTPPLDPWPEPGPLFRSPLRQEQSTSLRPDPAVEYQSCFAVERMDHHVFEHLALELALDPGREAILHAHAPGNRLSPSPLSRIQVEARPRSLSIHAYHTLPEERAIIRTQSLFELR